MKNFFIRVNLILLIVVGFFEICGVSIGAYEYLTKQIDIGWAEVGEIFAYLMLVPLYCFLSAILFWLFGQPFKVYYKQE